jgi:hypothetical protein
VGARVLGAEALELAGHQLIERHDRDRARKRRRSRCGSALAAAVDSRPCLRPSSCW